MSRRSRRKGRDITGILVLDKPVGESSNRSLQRVKRLFNANKAGHTGSLDPLASGVLPICLGEATKLSSFILDADKAYRVTIKLGEKTDTADSEGQVIQQIEPDVSLKQLDAALKSFSGEIQQLPPMYSALKHQGQPLYKYARKGVEIERKTRLVTIHSCELQSFDGINLELVVECSKGTYIRSIADDLGDMLGCGGHVTALRRLKAGPFTIAQAQTMEGLDELAVKGLEALDNTLQNADLAVSNLPAVRLSDDVAHYIRLGQAVITRHLPTEGLVRLYSEDVFIGIGSILEDGRVAPKRLFI